MNQDIKTYFLNIPRTSGRATHTDIHNAGIKLSTLSFDEYLSSNSWDDNSLLCGHFGNHPMKNNQNIKAFTLVRNPVFHTASMSIFAPSGISKLEFTKQLIYGEVSNTFPFIKNPQSSFIYSDIHFAKKDEDYYGRLMFPEWRKLELPRISFSDNATKVSDVVEFAHFYNIEVQAIENRKVLLHGIARRFGISSVKEHEFAKETASEIEEFCMDNKEAIIQKHSIDHALHSLALLGL